MKCDPYSAPFEVRQPDPSPHGRMAMRNVLLKCISSQLNQQARLASCTMAPHAVRALRRLVDTFLKAVDTAAATSSPGTGFAAVKVTALGNPLLLERISTAIRTIWGLFSKFDLDGVCVL